MPTRRTMGIASREKSLVRRRKLAEREERRIRGSVERCAVERTARIDHLHALELRGERERALRLEYDGPRAVN